MGLSMLIGIDWGGTKIEGVAMEPDGRELLRLREPTPRHDYHGCLAAIRAMIAALEAKTGRTGSIGIGIPGSLEPKSRLGKGASSTWILGKPVEADLQVGSGPGHSRGERRRLFCRFRGCGRGRGRVQLWSSP